MQPGSCFPSSELTGTVTTKKYDLVAMASLLTGEAGPLPFMSPGIGVVSGLGSMLAQGLVSALCTSEHTRMVQHGGLARHPSSPLALAWRG